MKTFILILVTLLEVIALGAESKLQKDVEHILEMCGESGKCALAFYYELTVPAEKRHIIEKACIQGSEDTVKCLRREINAFGKKNKKNNELCPKEQGGELYCLLKAVRSLPSQGLEDPSQEEANAVHVLQYVCGSLMRNTPNGIRYPNDDSSAISCLKKGYERYFAGKEIGPAIVSACGKVEKCLEAGVELATASRTNSTPISKICAEQYKDVTPYDARRTAVSSCVIKKISAIKTFEEYAKGVTKVDAKVQTESSSASSNENASGAQ